MPKLLHVEKVGVGVSIGVLQGNGIVDTDYAGTWYARLKYERKPVKTVATGIAWQGGDAAQKEKAKAAAIELWGEQYHQTQTGKADKTHHLKALTDEYVREVVRLADENENDKRAGRPPRNEVKGGRGYHSTKSASATISIVNKYVLPFWNSLCQGKRKDISIHNVTPQTLDTIADFCRGIEPTLSPSQILKVITQIRHIYRFAYSQETISIIPQIARPKAQMKERARRELTDEEHRQITEWTRARYLDEGTMGQIQAASKLGEVSITAVDTYRDYAYLFHLWCRVLLMSGIRPPTGGTDSTLMRWEDYKEYPIEIEGKEQTAATLHREEKNHSYDAAILPDGIFYFRELKRFQEERGIESKYIFAHPIDDPRWRKGDPIKNFRKQWDTMMKALGFNEGATLQKDRITPSAFRSYYITARLKYGGVDIGKLALAAGTSTDVIYQHYYKFSTEAELPELTVGGFYGETRLEAERQEGTGYYISR